MQPCDRQLAHTANSGWISCFASVYIVISVIHHIWWNILKYLNPSQQNLSCLFSFVPSALARALNADNKDEWATWKRFACVFVQVCMSVFLSFCHMDLWTSVSMLTSSQHCLKRDLFCLYNVIRKLNKITSAAEPAGLWWCRWWNWKF